MTGTLAINNTNPQLIEVRQQWAGILYNFDTFLPGEWIATSQLDGSGQHVLHKDPPRYCLKHTTWIQNLSSQSPSMPTNIFVRYMEMVQKRALMCIYPGQPYYELIDNLKVQRLSERSRICLVNRNALHLLGENLWNFGNTQMNHTGVHWIWYLLLSPEVILDIY